MDFTEVELAFFAAGDALADELEPVLAEAVPQRPSFWQRMFRRDVERDDDYAAYVLEV